MSDGEVFDRKRQKGFDLLTKLCVEVFVRIFYYVRMVGRDKIPKDGGALIVCNHVTWVDALLLASTIRRPVRFVMSRVTYDRFPIVRALLRAIKVIPIANTDSPKKLIASMREARATIDDGQLVCIFPEGALTQNANLREFKSGFERIIKDSDCPIIPMYIGGAWGSILSYKFGRPLSTMPRRIPYPVAVIVGDPLPSTATAFEVRQTISKLSSSWFSLDKHRWESLARIFVHTARKNWNQPIISDTTGKRLKYGKALISATALSDEIAKLCKDQKMVGILLPATVGAALTNVAITMCGKVSVNLNFTTAHSSIASAISQCEIKTIISSKAFIKKLKDFTIPEGTVYLEDILPRLTTGAKIKALLKALFMPARRLTNSRDASADDLATVIFSSGSTGDPKGVMLSHHNVISNIQSFAASLRFESSDHMCASLPFFHSFGFTCTLWFPLTAGLPVCYHPNPLEGDKVAEVVRTEKSTILLATPTFLLSYIRRAKPEDFESLTYVITGAEKLRERVAEAFEKKFNIAPLEGYGVTEMSPAISVNVPDQGEGRLKQIGRRKGTIGQAIPGVTVKIVDPDTDEELPPGIEGIIMVSGPNVMLGYLNRPDLTAEVVRNGWYDTGDIGRMTEDGFVTITDRASRFSKIAGEMVPHVVIEDVMLQQLDTDSRVAVVTSVVDERKGERLVVLFTAEAGTVDDLHGIIGASSLPNLWRPRQEDFLLVESIPVLGSGKLDLKQVRITATEIITTR